MKQFLPVIRIASGLFIAYLFIIGFMGKLDWFIGFNNAREILFNPNEIYLAKARFGIIVMYAMAVVSVYFIVIAREWHLHFFGFFLALVTFVVLLAF